MNFINRKLGKVVSSTTEIVKINDLEYGLITAIPMISHQQTFIPGVEIEQTTIDGRKVKNIFTIEGNKLIEKQIEPNREVTIIREFFDNEMLGESIVGNVKNKHWSKAVD